MLEILWNERPSWADFFYCNFWHISEVSSICPNHLGFLLLYVVHLLNSLAQKVGTREKTKCMKQLAFFSPILSLIVFIREKKQMDFPPSFCHLILDMCTSSMIFLRSTCSSIVIGFIMSGLYHKLFTCQKLRCLPKENTVFYW